MWKRHRKIRILNEPPPSEIRILGASSLPHFAERVASTNFYFRDKKVFIYLERLRIGTRQYIFVSIYAQRNFVSMG